MIQFPPFIVLGLPRSRTAWISRFLSYGDWHCAHEQLRYARSIVDVSSWLSMKNVGTAETAATAHWRLIKALCPKATVVVIRRDPEEVISSMCRLKVPGVEFDAANIRELVVRLNRKLNAIEVRVPGVISIPYTDLETEEGLQVLWKSTLPYSYDPAWANKWHDINVQIDVALLIKYYLANLPQLQHFAMQAKELTLQSFRFKKSLRSETPSAQIIPFRRA